MRVALFLSLMLIMPVRSYGSDLAYSFNSPSFSGQGYSAHTLAIEQLQQNAQQQIVSQRAQAAAAAERAALNNPINQFIGNFESIVYQQLAKQLSDALFGQNPSSSGTVNLAGNTINYLKVGSNINLTITDTAGSVTQVQVPVSSLGF